MYQLLVLSANNQQQRLIEQQLQQAAAARNAQLFTGKGRLRPTLMSYPVVS